MTAKYRMNAYAPQDQGPMTGYPAGPQMAAQEAWVMAVVMLQQQVQCMRCRLGVGGGGCNEGDGKEGG